MIHFLNPGYSYYRQTALDETKRSVKANAGNVYGFTFINSNTVPVYIKFYNALVGDVTVGTTVPLTVLMVPAGNGTTPGQVVATVEDAPFAHFNTGITIAAVTGVADSSTGAPTTDLHAEVVYR